MAAATLSADVATKISTEASTTFIELYYPALNSHRHQIASFYAASASMPDGKPIPIITWNGNLIPDAQTLQKLYEEQMPRSHYEVQSYDCTVLNPNYVTDHANAPNASTGKNMTILLQVSGYVKYGTSKAVPLKCFSETFILVPNPVAHSARSRNQRPWLIQTQTFRLVV